MQKSKRFVSLLLAFVCFCFTACPFLAYGATDFTFTLLQYLSTDSSGTSDQGSGNLPYGYLSTKIWQADTRNINIFFSEDVFNVSKDDTVEVHVSLGSARYASMSVTAYLYAPSSSTASSAGVVERVTGSYDASDMEVTAEIPCSRDYQDAYIVLSLSSFKYANDGNDYHDFRTYMLVQGGYVQLIDAEQGFWASVVDWFQQIFDSITEGFDNIGEWFTDLGNNITTAFSALLLQLKSWFDDIGDWFTDLGNNISGFFEKLWNRIYWGNENGEAEYEPPVIDNKLNDVIDQLEDWQSSLKDTVDDINSAATNVSGYISTGTQLVNGVIGVGGVAFTALITFGIVFVLVRKVVGR